MHELNNTNIGLKKFFRLLEKYTKLAKYYTDIPKQVRFFAKLSSRMFGI